jgi:hypothetical protein
VILPLNLREKFLDIVQALPSSQPQPVGPRAIGAELRRFLDRMQTGAKRLVDHAPERRSEPLGNSPCFIQNIIVYSQRCSHAGIIASRCMMSRHHAVYDAILSLFFWRLARALVP